MVCPYFVDFTRNCVGKIPSVIRYQNFDICEGNAYNDCLIYNLMNSKYHCKYLHQCIDDFTFDVPTFFKKMFSDDKFNKFASNLSSAYCLSESHSKDCERYKKYELGEKPPIRLFPDGKSHYFDIFFKKEITIK